MFLVIVKIFCTPTSIIVVTLWVRVFRFFPGRNLSERKLRLEKSRRRYDYYGDTKITGCAGMCVTAVIGNIMVHLKDFNS